MLFEDQFEQLKEYSQSLGAQIQESSTFNNLKDRYVAMSPAAQKIILILFCLLLLFFILITPIANYTASVENMKSFEKRKELTQKIVSFEKKSSTSTAKPKEYQLAKLNDAVERLGTSYSINYLPEQTSVFTKGARKKLVLGSKQRDFTINAKNTNIAQFANLSYHIQKKNKSLFVSSLELVASKDKPGYFNGRLEVSNLFVDPISDILPKPQEKKSSKRNRRRGR